MTFMIGNVYSITIKYVFTFCVNQITLGSRQGDGGEQHI